MSSIQLRLDPLKEKAAADRRLEAIYGFVEGDYQIELRFLAEPHVFFRMAQNMTGHEPDLDEVKEYAMEFVNVLCGRFVSELYKATRTSARFYPTRYEMSPDLACLSDKISLSTLYFISDEHEVAAFSWSAEPIKDLLRRNLHVEA